MIYVSRPMDAVTGCATQKEGGRWLILPWTRVLKKRVNDINLHKICWLDMFQFTGILKIILLHLKELHKSTLTYLIDLP